VQKLAGLDADDHFEQSTLLYEENRAVAAFRGFYLEHLRSILCKYSVTAAEFAAEVHKFCLDDDDEPRAIVEADAMWFRERYAAAVEARDVLARKLEKDRSLTAEERKRRVQDFENDYLEISFPAAKRTM
jgi:hypothetical protein